MATYNPRKKLRKVNSKNYLGQSRFMLSKSENRSRRRRKNRNNF